MIHVPEPPKTTGTVFEFLIKKVDELSRRIDVLEGQLRELKVAPEPPFPTPKQQPTPAQQKREIIRIIKEYFKLSPKARRVYIPKGAASLPLVHVRYIRRRARDLSVFKNDLRGEAFAVVSTLHALVVDGTLLRVTADEVHAYYPGTGRVKSDFYTFAKKAK